jgi:hypothetical protein
MYNNFTPETMLNIVRQDVEDIAARAAIKANGGLYYDYARQCWIEGGRVLICGHREPQALCYACNHAGETV